MKNLRFIIGVLFITLIIFSCKKEGFITSPEARLNTSIDTLKFDTVFTSTGSITRSFKIFNDNNQRLKLNVKLMGGATSAFKINVNGVAGPELNNIDIAADDSIYVFVSVNVNPTAANLPFVLSDSISLNYNGNTRFIQLQAFGQNANFLRSTIITTNTTWNATLPYVILDGIQVAENATLTIPAGTKIYSHADAPFIVDGTLIVNGTAASPVLFTGDRLDDPYFKFPSSWPGIYFRAASKNSVMRFANVLNAYQAVVVSSPSVNANPKLIIHQSTIDNAANAGLLLTNTNVQVDNSLISNSGTNVSIVQGGNYSFTNCTIVGISNQYVQHRLPALKAANFTEVNGTQLTADLNAYFKNCIFWGDNTSLASELDIQKQGSNPFNFTLDHCLYRANGSLSNVTSIASIENQEPVFDSVDTRAGYYDFRNTKTDGPAVNAGTSTSFPRDRDDRTRSVGITDIGCYERQ